MIGKKALLGSAIGGSGLATARLRLWAPPRDQLLVLAYHRVLDIGDEAVFAQDPELVSASVRGFEQQMRFVRDHFQVLRLAEVISCLESGRPLAPCSAVITFDDGHLDNHTHAFPVLRRLGLSACIFLSTDYIDSERMFWFDRVALLLYHAPAGRWQVAGQTLALPPDDVAARREAAGGLLRHLKRVPDAQRLACLQALEDLFAARVPAGGAPARSALNWDEVREMAQGGIEFGSHTCSHPILSRLDDAQLAHELGESRRLIGEQTGQPVDAIAYPIGKSGAYDQRVLDASRRCGYRLGISYETGINSLRSLQPFALRRLAVERYTGLPLFKGMMAFPALLA